MIRLTRCTKAARAGQYFRLHLETGDSPEATIKTGVSLRPMWFGQGSKIIGLSDLTPPTAKHLTRLGSGLHPTKNERLAPKVNRKRAYYDLTIAAPKSISIAALLRPDHPTARAILNAHVRAAEKAVLELAPCVRRQTPNSPPVPGWIGVNFHHTHSREGDPHLHTHVIIPNIAKTEAGDWRAIQLKIGGPRRQRLELRYGHELAKRLRRIGLGHEVVMRPNGLPELKSLMQFRATFSKAGQAVWEAAESAGVQIHPIPDAPADGVLLRPGRSGLPTHPQSGAVKMRQSIADTIRKPKAKGSDQPSVLREEAQRWTSQFTNQQMRAYLDFLNENDEMLEQRRAAQGRPGPGTQILSEPLPALRDLISQAKRSHLSHLNRNTPAVVFRAVMQDAAGRYEWKDIRAALVVHLAERRKILEKIRRQINEDSIRIEADRIEKANLAARGIIIVPLPADPRAIQAANDICDEGKRIRAAIAATKAAEAAKAAEVPVDTPAPVDSQETPPERPKDTDATQDEGRSGGGRRRR